MRSITKKVYSHKSIKSGKKYYVREVRASDALSITSFRELVEAVARITFENPDYSIFYRGQSEDILNTENETTILPSLYRVKTGRIIRTSSYEKRIEDLEKAEKLLLEEFERNSLEGKNKVQKFREVAWAILQHYKVCETPLLDITHSLRVATSFALSESRETGYLYLLGFPHINGSISYFVEEELVNVKLLSSCPPIALRPYYQEGFLVGTFPIPMNRAHTYDFNRRLIAKFKINVNNFWDSDFAPIPQKALYPDKKDQMKKICDDIKLNLKNDV